MTSLADRLRDIVRPAQVERTRPGDRSGQECDDAAEVLGGEWRDARGRPFLVIERTLRPGHRHGDVAIADTLPPEAGVWPRLPLLGGAAASASSGRMLFVDLETTGLAGGAGTYAFLVGCAWYQDGALRIRQFVLSHFDAERALLEAVADTAGACGTVVTYNGKSFDLPLIETRFVIHRMATPFAEMPHVDMLHPARRLWRDADGDGSDTRLTTLEQTRCGYVREGDVPGFEIPSRYFHFVRTGDARALAAVTEHNRLDLVSLAVLTARASQLLEDGAAAATATEALGLAGLYERAGMLGEALASYTRAATCPDADRSTRARAWRGCAVALRRERRFTEAAEAWRRILELGGCPESLMREAADALAVHHEHRVRDLQAARAFALRSLRGPSTPSRQQATAYRLARLDRKLGSAPTAAPALF